MSLKYHNTISAYANLSWLHKSKICYFRRLNVLSIAFKLAKFMVQSRVKFQLRKTIPIKTHKHLQNYLGFKKVHPLQNTTFSSFTLISPLLVLNYSQVPIAG